MNNTIYTFGHSNHSIEEFIKLVKLHNVNCVCDVRSSPFSKFVPHFNKDNFKRELNNVGIQYIEMGKEFGARRIEANLLTNGIVDFDKVAKDKTFQSGIERVMKGLKKDYVMTFICAEKDPIDCHRNILVAKNLQDHGIKVLHILFDGSIEDNSRTEQRLVEKFIPIEERLYSNDLFGKITLIDESNNLAKAYQEANRKIGYRTGDEEE
jgi:uncharacterized protein (DUF488 family)